MRILIVEDEPKVLGFLKQGLEEHGFDVDIASDGLEGKTFMETGSYELILLDILLPYINGNDLCKLIKLKKPEVPVIMLTALSTLQNKLEGFDAGADDYLIKPFEFKELLARIKVLTKRAGESGRSLNILRAGSVELDLDKKIARRGEREILLSVKEFSLLEYLIRNRGRVVSRPEIAEKIWEITFDTGTNVVDVYINFLRKKLDKDFPRKLIQTRIGMGYIFQED